MNIVIVNRHPEDVLGGSEIQCDIIANGLHERGHNVAYVAPAGNAGRGYNTSYTVVPVESDATAIARAVIDQEPCIVYWRFNKYFFYKSCKCIAEKDIPIIFAVSHIDDIKLWSYKANPRKGPVHALKAVKQGAMNFWNHRGYKYVSGLTSLNNDYLYRLPIPEQRFVANAMTTDAVPFSWARPFVLWVANIKPVKRPELFIDLARDLHDKDTDFLMVGAIQSSDYEWIKTARDDVHNLHYIGPKTIKEVNGIVSKCLFLAHTSKPEGFGNIFIQAWLHAKPTLAFEFDPGGYIEAHDFGGVSKGDWNAFVDQAKKLLDNQDERQKAGKRALEFASQTFSVERTVEEVEVFMREIVNHRKQGHIRR